MSKSSTSGVSVLARGDEVAQYYTVDEIEAEQPPWRIDGIELTEAEMKARHIPVPRRVVDGWTVRKARVNVGASVRICRVWSRRK